MGKIRREKRKLSRLLKNREYVNRYNEKVRKHNEKVKLQQKRAKRFEYLVFLGILIVFSTVLIYKLWGKGI